MCVRNRLPKNSAIERDEILIETFHFQFPFTLGHQWLRTYNKDIVQLISGFQLLNDQTGLNRFTDADAVRNQDLRFIRFDELKGGTELIWYEINSCCV